MRRHLNAITLFVIAALLNRVAAFMNGAPKSSCTNNVPHHNHIEPIQTPSPYSVTVDSTKYRPGDVITVTISSPGGKEFKGFQLRANRVTGDTEDIVGFFIQTPEGAQQQRWYSATNDSNCVTHSNNEAKTSVGFKWKAPDKSVGDVIFTAGVVLRFEEYWVNLLSPVVKAEELSEDPEFLSKVSPVFDPPIDIDACGKTKGCLVWPRACAGTSCKTVVTYQTVEGGTAVDFEIIASTTAWVGIGFSHDLKMGKDETYTCAASQDYVGIKHGFSPAYYNNAHRIVGTTNIQLAQTSNKVMCRFRRPIKTVLSPDGSNAPEKDMTYDLNNEYYLQVAIGEYYKGTPSAHIHKVLPLVSDGKVNFQSNKVVVGQLIYAELKAHAFMMLTSWLLLAGMTKIISAHLKQPLKKTWRGIAAWFQLHRALAFTIAVMTSVGNIIIFSYLKKLSTTTFAHAVCGIVVWCMLALQMVFGLLRPDKDSKYRQIWYWMHLLLGHVMHLLAALTMFLSVQTRLFDDDFRFNMTVILGCWLGAHVLWEILFSAKKSKDTGKTELELTSLGDKAARTESKKDDSLNVCFLLYVITMGTFYVASLWYVFTW